MLGDQVLRVFQSRLPAGLLLGMNDVLVDTTSWWRWLPSVLGRMGAHASYQSLCRVWQRRYAADVHCGRRDLCDAFRAFLASFGLTPAQADEVELACRTRRRQTEASARPLPGVRNTLVALHEGGMTLGVLTDSSCSGEAIRERLGRLGLADVLASILSSFDLGQVKPNPMGYLRSARAMGLEAEQILFVGHRATELAGAAVVGMRTAAFNYDEDARADVFLARFDELRSLAGAPVCRTMAG